MRTQATVVIPTSKRPRISGSASVTIEESASASPTARPSSPERMRRVYGEEVRICSLLPSATEIIAQLGSDRLAGRRLRGVPLASEVVGKPVVTAARIDPSTLTSLEIDRAVRESVGDGRSLYTVDADLIDTLAPDLIVTQDLCAVCAVSSTSWRPPARSRPRCSRSIRERSRGVAESVRILAATLGVVDRGDQIVSQMWETIEAAADSVRGLPRRRVFFAEWIEPPFCAGHWLPEMIELAGGTDILGNAGRPSFATTWETVLAHEPELVVIAPAGSTPTPPPSAPPSSACPAPPSRSTATATTPARRRDSPTASVNSPISSTRRRRRIRGCRQSTSSRLR